jgi:hypothetical protein
MSAGIIFNGGGGVGTNPTSNVIPVNVSGVFQDSNIVNDAITGIISTLPFGWFVDLGNYALYLGDYDNTNNRTNILVDDANNLITTFNKGFNTGLNLDFFNKEYKIGSYNVNNNTFIVISDNNSFISTYGIGGNIGLNLDFQNDSYQFGDFNNNNNGTAIIVDDNVSDITFQLQNKLKFFGGGLITTTPGGVSGFYLQIFINNVAYKIQLLT